MRLLTVTLTQRPCDPSHLKSVMALAVAILQRENNQYRKYARVEAQILIHLSINLIRLQMDLLLLNGLSLGSKD